MASNDVISRSRLRNVPRSVTDVDFYSESGATTFVARMPVESIGRSPNSVGPSPISLPTKLTTPQNVALM